MTIVNNCLRERHFICTTDHQVVRRTANIWHRQASKSKPVVKL